MLFASNVFSLQLCGVIPQGSDVGPISFLIMILLKAVMLIVTYVSFVNLLYENLLFFVSIVLIVFVPFKIFVAITSTSLLPSFCLKHVSFCLWCKKFCMWYHQSSRKFWKHSFMDRWSSTDQLWALNFSFLH